MDMMNAVVVHNGKRFSYEKLDRPSAGNDSIIIRVEAAGICAAERKIFSGNHPWDLGEIYLPGHEYVGVIEELNKSTAGETGLKVGDRITAEILVPCRNCWYCLQGLYQHCDKPRVCVGAWAEYHKIPKDALIHRIPAELPALEAVLVEPLSCSIHAVNLGEIEFNDTVVISGLGAIGMGMLQVAKLRSPKNLIGLDINDANLVLAKELGADYVANPLNDDVPAKLRKLTGGRGCDVYIEASGNSTSLQTGVRSLRKAGRLVIYGVYGQQVSIDFNQVAEFKELQIKGGHLSPHCFEPAIELLAKNKVNAEAMVTQTLPLEDFEEGLKRKKNTDGAQIKTVLIPGSK